MFSTGAHSLVIGADPKEWWTGSDVPDVWIVQTREVGRLLTLKPSGISAYCIGNVGWVADESLFTLGSGVALRVRLTAVLVIERGHWRSSRSPHSLRATGRLGSRAEIRSRSSTPPNCGLSVVCCIPVVQYRFKSYLLGGHRPGMRGEAIGGVGAAACQRPSLRGATRSAGRRYTSTCAGGLRPEFIGASVASRREHHREE